MELAVLWVICAAISAAIASSKGRSGIGWFFLGLLISIFAVILVAVLPSLKEKPIIVGGEIATPSTHVRCPKCKGLVPKEAEICMHCRSTLVPESKQVHGNPGMLERALEEMKKSPH
jgi:hypothetical protein